MREAKERKEGESVCVCVWWVRGEILFEAKKGRRDRERERKIDNHFKHILSSLSLDPYVSETEKKVVTVVATEDSKQMMCLNRLVVKVPAGDTGARAGLVFITNKDPTSEELSKQLEQYDSWTAEDYSKFLKER